MNPDHIAILEFLKGDRTPAKLVANPFIEALGGELVDADPDNGTVAIAFEPGAQFVQGAGVVQGGATSAMLDFALAFAGLTRVPLGTVFGTVSMTVHFMRPVTPGRYIAKGKVSRQGFHLFPKIREIDGLLRSRPDLVSRIVEVHPELAFWSLNGECPLAEPKKVKNRPYPPGLALRRALLVRAGLPRDMVEARPPRGAGW